ncbi:MAG: HAD hydrolase family protein [Chloroflexota bacterium]
MRRALTEQVVCFTMIGRLQQVAALDETLRAAYDGLIETHLYENQYSLGWHWLTIHDRRAGKEKAIQTLITLAGLKPSELVVFGDQVNDLACCAWRSGALPCAMRCQTCNARRRKSLARMTMTAWLVLSPLIGRDKTAVIQQKDKYEREIGGYDFRLRD